MSGAMQVYASALRADARRALRIIDTTSPQFAAWHFGCEPDRQVFADRLAQQSDADVIVHAVRAGHLRLIDQGVTADYAAMRDSVRARL